MKKIHALSLTALTVAGVLAAGAGVTYAASATADTPRPFTNLIEALSTRFGLNTTDVQQVFDEQHQQMRQERQADMQARLQERLATAVTDGKLTQTQQDLILAKHGEIQAFHASLIDMTVTERHDAIKAQADTLKQWTADNGIPTQFLPLAGGMGEGRGKGMGMGAGAGRGEGRGMGMGIHNR